VAVFFTAVFVIIVYFVLFPHPLGKEMIARPAWVRPVPQPGDPAASNSPADPGSLARFQLGGVFGYVDGDGRFGHVERTLYGVALSDTAYINYTRLGTDWILQDPRGKRLLSFSGSGYPLLSPRGDRIFIVKSDLSGLLELDSAGDQRWERDFPSLLTALSIQGTSMLAGLLDGSMVYVDAQGSPAVQAAGRASRIPVQLGVAVTADGRLAASVSGIGPQYLVLYGLGTAGFQQREVEILSTDFRREVRMSFSPGGRFLAFEGRGFVGVLDPAGGRFSQVALSGTMAGIAFPADGRLAAAAAVSTGRTDVAVFAPFGGLVFQEGFAAREVFLGPSAGSSCSGWMAGCSGWTWWRCEAPARCRCRRDAPGAPPAGRARPVRGGVARGQARHNGHLRRGRRRSFPPWHRDRRCGPARPSGPGR